MSERGGSFLGDVPFTALGIVVIEGLDGGC